MVDTYCSMMSLVAAPAQAFCVTLLFLHSPKLPCKKPSTAAADLYNAPDEGIPFKGEEGRRGGVRGGGRGGGGEYDVSMLLCQ